MGSKGVNLMKYKIMLMLSLMVTLTAGCAKTNPVQTPPPTEPVVETPAPIEPTPEPTPETPEETPVGQPTPERPAENTWLMDKIVELGLENHKEIQVDGGNLSGYREPLVKVNIGFGDRDYWAFTNEHGQLVVVLAENIILQNDETEPVLSTGRYYRDEAKVPGVEHKDLDEGHVIADSLGGVSNAYNITPQDSTLNRHGDQAYMERVIRDAGGANHFFALIEYPNTITHIPSHYNYEYVVKGNSVKDSYPNGNPEKTPIKPTPTPNPQTIPIPEPEPRPTPSTSKIRISDLNKAEESVKITNDGDTEVNIGGWKLVSETGNQSFTFPKDTFINPGQTIELVSGGNVRPGEYVMAKGNIWNNSSPDPAVLYDALGNEVHRLDN